MRQGQALRWLLLAAGVGLAGGCARPMDVAGLAPPVPSVAASRTLAADWDRMGRLAAGFPGVARSARSPQAAPEMAAPVGSALSLSPSGKIIWPKEQWEIDLDKKVYNMCRGC